MTDSPFSDVPFQEPSRTDQSIAGLNFLRFTQEEWGRHNHDCHYQNRLRHGHYSAMAAQAGFAVEDARAVIPLPMPEDARSDLLLGDGNDHFMKGFYVLRNV